MAAYTGFSFNNPPSYPKCTQARESEDAETAGSRFAQECQELYTSDRVTELLYKFIGQLDVLFAAASENSGD